MFAQPLFLFQDPSLGTGGDVPKAESYSLMEVILNSGTIGLVITLTVLVLGIFAVYIFAERAMSIKRAGNVDQMFMSQIRGFVQNGDIHNAILLCKNTNTPVARLVEKGLQRIGKPLEDIHTAVENVGNLEIYRLERRISWLATISGAAPMIGFLGTVTGMILSFMTMAQGDVTPTALASGIYQALITTAFGLVVGIIAFVGYNYLISSVDRVVFKMEAATVEFFDLLQEPA